jgi:hypothetical protein
MATRTGRLAASTEERAACAEQRRQRMEAAHQQLTQGVAALV